MSSDENLWPQSELGKEAFNASRPFPFQLHSEVVFVNTGDVFQGKFLHSDISPSTGLPGQAKKAIKPDDILLTEIRPGNGRYAYVDFDAAKYVVSTKFMVIESHGRIKSKFLYYVLTNQVALDEFQRIAESRSGTFPQITFDSIEHFPVPVPPFEVQDEVIAFLDAIDCRIALLRDTNITLEEIAHTLFKSWFVDFEPVRAKMEGRNPEGIDQNTAALFPNRLVTSSTGAAPEGWQDMNVESLCSKVTRGQTPIYGVGSGIYIINQKVNRGTSLDMTALKELSPDLNVSKEKMAQKWDVLINCLGEGTLGRIHLYKGESLKYAVDQHMSICRGSPALATYLYQVFSSPAGQERIDSMKTGSTGMTMLNVSKLREFTVLWPGQELANRYFEIVEGLYQKISNNDENMNALEQTREALIPRLISGRLKFSGIDSVKKMAVA